VIVCAPPPKLLYEMVRNRQAELLQPDCPCAEPPLLSDTEGDGGGVVGGVVGGGVADGQAIEFDWTPSTVAHT